MCGIVGAVAFNGTAFQVTDSYINKMRDTMAHRGPDGAGTWVSGDGRVGLGHRRLAIIDLSEAAAQPMSNEDDTLWVSFNGEIYNHAEIRQELEKRRGHRWKTDHSDTEVIIHAFEEWGIDCLQRFRGMFAIALWDNKNRELWLVRDRIGIKPLYYSIHHGRLTFASEIKALLQDPDQPRAMHEEAFYHFLSFLCTPAPDTLFVGIKKVPGGTWLRIRENGDLLQERFWDVWDHTTPLQGVSEEEIADRLLEELRTAVNLRRVSDVPVGVFLSGGIDSSTNAALFSEGEGGPVKTFTIGYQADYQSYPNEVSYARKMADLIGAQYHERLLNIEDLLDFLPRMVYLQDEPIADPVCVPIYYVSKLARDNGVIVCQVGEGSDELFCGYEGWKQSLALQKLNDMVPGKWAKRLAVAFLDRFDVFHDRFKLEYLRRASLGKPIFWGGAEAFSELQKRRLLHPRLRRKFARYSSWEAIEPTYRRFQEKAWEKSHLNWMSYLDLNLRLPELLLMRVDKMSMGVSLEGRVPFLDHKFVELSMSIPAAIKFKNNNLKHILKKAVRGLIPDEFIDRKKQGFGVPVYEWYSERLGDKIRQEIMEFCEETDFLDSDEVLRMLRKGKGVQLWYLLNLAMWWKQYVK